MHYSEGDGIPADLFQILKDYAIKVLHSVCKQIWKTQQWLQDWKRSVLFQSKRKTMPKNVQTTTQLCSFHMLARCCSKSFKVGLNLSDVQAGFRKGRGTRDQTANIQWIIKKAREFHKNIYFCFIVYAKAFDSVVQNKLWKILKEMRISDHLIYLLRNLYTGQESTVKTRHGTTDWFKIWKGVCQGCILSPCLFNLYAEYIMQNARLDEAKLESRLL